MKNDDINDYVNPVPEPPVSLRDILTPLLALGLAILYFTVFGLNHIEVSIPGVGILLFVCAYYGAVLWLLGRRADWDALSLFLFAASLLLGAACALYANIPLRILNCLILLVTCAGATFSLSGQLRHTAASARVLTDTVSLSLRALFTRVGRVFAVSKRLRRERGDRLLRILLSAASALVVLAVVLALLTSADAVFGSFFDGLRLRLQKLRPGPTVWHIVRAAVLALLISSGLYFIREELPAPDAAGTTERERHVLPFLLVTLLLDGVYILFCAVQIKFLFGGASAAAMAGGWAEYARTGFFQLVAVAAINLALCVPGSKAALFKARGGLALRLANGLLLALTAVILLSAARRMQLYIGVFGLSILRLMTLWGMLVIAVCLLGAGWKLAKPAFPFFALFGGFALGTWCLLCLCNPAGGIAGYNVNRYLSGELPSVDVYYLDELGPDAVPAVRRLQSRTDEYDEDIRAAYRWYDESDARLYWADWTLSDAQNRPDMVNLGQ